MKVSRFLHCLALFFASISAQAEFTLDLMPVAPGVAALQFFRAPGYYFCLESSADLTSGFVPASGWMLGDGATATWPLTFPTSPATGGTSTTTAGDTFSLYPFHNGKTLVTWRDPADSRFSVLVAQDYSALPPIVVVSENASVPNAMLLVGRIAWDPAYEALVPALLPTAQQPVLARLPTPAAAMAAATRGGTSGPGVIVDAEKQFFRIRRMEADADGDGLDWALETFILGTDPDNADTDNDGISDSEEIAQGLNPGSDDSDGDTVKDGSDAYPNDERRSEDIPVKFYGVIDLTKYLPVADPFELENPGRLEIAIDDENRVAFGGLVQHPPANESTLRTVVWKTGAIERDTTLEFPYSPSVAVQSGDGISLSFHRHTWPDAFGLNAQGVVEGFASVQIVENEEPPDVDYMWPARFAAETSLQIQPLAHSSYPPPPYPLWRPIMFSPKGTAFYVETALAGGEVSTPIFGMTPFTAYQSTRWSGNETGPSDAVASSEDDLMWKLIRNDSAQTVSIQLYDHTTGANAVVTGIPGGATLLALNSSKQVVGDLRTEEPSTTANPYGRGWLGFLWDNGTFHIFHDLLPEKFRKQIRSAIPVFISNVESDTGMPTITFTAECLEGASQSPIWKQRNLLLVWTVPAAGQPPEPVIQALRVPSSFAGGQTTAQGSSAASAAGGQIEEPILLAQNGSQIHVGKFLVNNSFGPTYSAEAEVRAPNGAWTPSKNRLKIGLLDDDSFNTPPNANPTKKTDWLSRDDDQFRIVVRLPHAQATSSQRVKVKISTETPLNPFARISTTNPKDPDYSDPPSEIELLPHPTKPGVFVSKPQLLVSDRLDDEEKHPDGYGGEVAHDEALNDSSHIIGLGGIVFVWVNTPEGEKKLPVAWVPVERIIHIEPVRFAGTNASNEATIKDHIKVSAERLAPAGIRVEHGEVRTITPSEAGISSGTVEQPGESGSVPTHTATLFRNIHESSLGAIVVYYAEALTPNDNGVSTPPKYFPEGPNGDWKANKILVNVGATKYTLSHELMHLLLNGRHADFTRCPTVPNPLTSNIWLTWPSRVYAPEFVNTRRIAEEQRPKVLENNKHIILFGPYFNPFEE